MGWDGIRAFRVSTGGDDMERKLQKAYDEGCSDGYEKGREDGWREAMEEADRSGLRRGGGSMRRGDMDSQDDDYVGENYRHGFRRRR